MPVTFRAEDSPRGLWRSLGKRVGLTALAGSNPASSASLKQALTCGNAVRIRSALDGVASNIEAASLNFGRSFRPPTAPKSGLPRSRRVCRRSLTYASPDQPAAKASWDARRSNIGSRTCSDQRPLCLDNPPTPRRAPRLRAVVDPLRHGSANLGGGPSHAPGSRESVELARTIACFAPCDSCGCARHNG
jgi:hypothetical protein